MFNVLDNEIYYRRINGRLPLKKILPPPQLHFFFAETQSLQTYGGPKGCLSS